MTDLKIVPLHHMDEVLEMALYPPTEKAPRPARRKRAPEAETPSENE